MFLDNTLYVILQEKKRKKKRKKTTTAPSYAQCLEDESMSLQTLSNSQIHPIASKSETLVQYCCCIISEKMSMGMTFKKKKSGALLT